MKKITKILLPVLSAAALISCGSTATGVANTGSNAVVEDNATSQNEGAVAVALLDKHEDVADSIGSGVSFLLIETNGVNTLNLLRRANAPGAASVTNEELIEHLNDVNPFLPTAEKMMSGEKSASSVTYTEGADLPYTMTFIDGTVLSYKETRIEGKEHDEEQFILEGVCTIDGVSYNVTGRREVENEIDETEYETSFTISLDSGYSITIESENESEATETEESFAYTFRQDRTEILEVELSYEVEGNKKEMSVEVATIGKEAEYILGELADGFSLSYEFEDEVNDVEVNGLLTVTIDEVNALYIYKDSAGNVITSLPRA